MPKISALPPVVDALVPTDLLPIVHAANTSKITLDQLTKHLAKLFDLRLTATKLPPNGGQGWNAIGYGAGKFVALANYASVGATSVNGLTWVATSTPGSSTVTGLNFNGALFFYSDSSQFTQTTNCYKSVDGAVWSLAAAFPNQGGWSKSAVMGSKICFIDTANGRSAVTVDGASWAAGLLPTQANTWSDIAASDSVFVAVRLADPVATSPDGINWTSRVGLGFLVTNIAWNGSVFCAMSRSPAANSGPLRTATSADGITWNATGLMVGQAQYAGITRFGSRFIVFGNADHVQVSDDGLTWAIVPLPYLSNFLAGVTGGGVCALLPYIYGDNTRTIISSNGTEWA